MRIVALQHVAFESPGLIEEWALERGHVLQSTQLWAGEALPALETLDMLAVMGGPMSVNDESTHAWLKPEKTFIRAVLDAGRPVVGVCLGAQMLANVLGSRVYKNKEKEIGWQEIEWLDGTAPQRQKVFQWHGETFDLPRGARQLARSAACETQAFSLGRALALQFHLEITPEIVERLLAECASDIGAGSYEQSAEEIRAGLWRVEELRPQLFACLDRSAGA